MAGPQHSAFHFDTSANFAIGTNASLDEVEAILSIAGEQKAEIINGELIFMSPTGGDPGYAGDEIYSSLRAYAKERGIGRAMSDNKAFLVVLPKRKSFSPDAAYYLGPRPGMKFYRGAPIFAVEVRSEGDYGPAAEFAMAEKRADYFAAGTLVVWDVDLLSDDVVRVHRADAPDTPTRYRRGQTAEAEPAVPGWSMSVDELFDCSGETT
ncbi:MAG: Uma2 family endonuclease [Pirellulales bacterium]